MDLKSGVPLRMSDSAESLTRRDIERERQLANLKAASDTTLR
jgi:hypothetical protein